MNTTPILSEGFFRRREFSHSHAPHLLRLKRRISAKNHTLRYTSYTLIATQ